MIFPDLKTPLLWVLGLGLVAALATAGIERTRAAGARADAATARKDLANYKLSVSETSRILQAANDRKAADNHARQLEAINAARSRETLAARVADDLRLDRDRLLRRLCRHPSQSLAQHRRHRPSSAGRSPRRRIRPVHG
ncbi:hypothetical protein [Variovorax boronicumulans]|uniref:hypothetical protein n=1 Tax=Variovorax boronicumulans TaxID=436515 RepID=UPI0012E57A02|nr:hypothetical protein [Variovorax boronicumulans]GER13367.1 hypothetical protein VHAB30_45520 [Variovorax boronicumulans]